MHQRHFLCFLLFVVMVLTHTTSAQVLSSKGLSDSTNRIIEAGLKEMGMRLSDMWMPADILATDVHRLPVVSSLFTKPLSSFSTVQYHASELKQLSFNSADAYFGVLLQQLQFGEYKLINFENIMTSRELDDRLQSGLDTLLALEGAVMMRQYCAPFFLAADAINESRDKLLRRDILMKYCDSMLLQS